MHMYACICMYVHVCICMCVCMCVLCMHVCMYVYVCMHSCIHVYVCIIHVGKYPGEMSYPKREGELSGGKLSYTQPDLCRLQNSVVDRLSSHSDTILC